MIKTILVTLISIFILVGCGKQEESKTSQMSDKDKAALKGAIAVEMIKKGHEEEGRRLFKQAQDDWFRAQDNR